MAAIKGGYAGRIAWVDLTKRQVSIKDVDPVFAREYVGGRGWGARIVWDHVPPEADPLGPENVLVVAAGPLTGLLVPGAGKVSFSAISPETGYYGDSNSGGFFGPELKHAGFDALIITGASKEPVYLWVEDGQIEIRNASSYWGMGGLEVQEALRRDLGDSSIKVASIGPAGENLVSIACVNCDWRNAGRCGMGAVMGSKRLKAIAVRGSLDIPVADPEALYEEAKGAFKHVRDHEFARVLRKYGLAWYIDWSNENACLPVKNFRFGTYELHEAINAETMLKRVVTTSTACPRCPMCCGKFSYVRSGRYAGTAIDGPEYETLAMLGANCCLPTVEDVVYANWLCDNLGLDTISAGNIIAFAIECYEKGIIGPEDTGGLELRYGDPDCVFKLLKLMAKREGIGDVLARGVKFAANKFGGGSERFAMHVKGLEQSAYDVRAAPAMGLAYATADIGAHHNRAWAITYDIEKGRDTYTRDKAEKVIYLQHVRPLFDMLGCCRLQWVETGLSLDYYAKAYEAATGIKVSADELLRASERVFNLTRAINVRRGLTSAEDRLPDRVFEEPVPDGVVKGYKLDRAKFAELLRAYYELRGWDPETGVPTRAKLEELGLKDVADALGL